jgi:ATP adenylyltransferase
MERLWTPWRMSYVVGTANAATGSSTAAESSAGNAGGGGQALACFLCAKGGDDAARDRENLIVYRDALAFVVLNLYPYNSGHVLVAPYAHVGDFTALPAEIGHALFDLTQRTVAALQEEYRPDAFNVGINLGRTAGAGVPDHLHVHVVPRWDGDTNFMPVLANTKVLPEALDQTWERLRRHFM